jgi:hypothetical protein
LRTNELMPSIAIVSVGKARFELVKHRRDLRHDVGDEEDHDHDRDQRDDRGIQGGADQLALQLLAFLEVVGEAFEDCAERAALLAGGDDAAVDLVEFARRTRQRARERRAGVDFAAQVRDQLALARVFGLVAEGRSARVRAAGRSRPARRAGVSRPARPVVPNTRRDSLNCPAWSGAGCGDRRDGQRDQATGRATGRARRARCRRRAGRSPTCRPHRALRTCRPAPGLS